MHVDAFYEYLLENPHPYYTEIPSTSNPVTEGGRDGVAAEDDMALRSLLPHIRPRRGRKRPDETTMSRSPSNQRPKMIDAASSDGATTEQQELDFWATSPDPRSNDFLYAPQDQFNRMAMDMPHGSTTASSWMQPEDFSQTPISTHSYAAITPFETLNTLWSDPNHESTAEGFSSGAITPTGSKQNRRHGAKVVSSAWRSGGPGGSGKTRGRPPMKRQHTSHPQQNGKGQNKGELSLFSTYQTSGQSSSPPSTLGHNTPLMSSSTMPTALMTVGSDLPTTTITAVPDTAFENQSLFDMKTQEQHDRDERKLPGQLSLQLEVPERLGGDIGMASSYSHHERTPIPILLNDGASIASEHPSMFAPQGLITPEMHLMQVNPIASSAQDMYLPPDFQQRQGAHDPQLRMASQGTTLYHREASMPQGMIRSNSQQHRMLQHSQPPISTATSKAVVPDPTIGSRGVTYQDSTDRTNLDNVESLIAYTLLSASWHDAAGQSIPACEVEEAVSIASALIETVRKGATSQETFLSNISTLTGTTFLKRPEGHTVRVYRIDDGEEREDSEQSGRSRIRESVYDIHWDLRLGDIRGGFHLREKVKYVKSKGSSTKNRGPAQEKEAEAYKDAEGNVKEAHGQRLSEGTRDLEKHGEGEAEWWRRKYQALLGVVQEQNVELGQLRREMLSRDKTKTVVREAGHSRRREN